MKSMIKMLWVLTLALTINPLFANEKDPGLKLRTAGAKRFVVHFDIPVECTAHIRIKDTKGILLLNERYRNVTTMSAKINLATLPEGAYFVEVEDRLKVRFYAITMTGDGLNIEHQAEKDITKPLFEQKGKYVNMCMLLLPEDKAMVSIFSGEGKLVLQKAVDNYSTLENRFNVSHLQRGTYSFVVVTSDRTFTQTVDIR